MKKLLLFCLAFLSPYYFIFSPSITYAQVPQENRMKLTEISDLLPRKEMLDFFQKMEPLMLQVFGPPFSNVNLKIKADAEGTVHDTGFIDNEQTLVLAGQAKDYLKNKDINPKHALGIIYGNMLHELSHAQYYYGTKRVSFYPQWINEGWTKVSETLVGMELSKKESRLFTSEMVNTEIGTLPYFRLFLDPDTIAGTRNWGASKQNTNHGIVYDVTTLIHLTLISAASTSNENLDFFKTFNNTVYNWVKANNQTNIPFEDYKKIMSQLLQGKTIDGQSAFDWYFNNPDSLINGKLGDHLGVTVEPREIVTYAFRRVAKNNDVFEKPIANLAVKVQVKDYQGNEILNRVIKTDVEGNGRIPLPKIEDKAVITISASANIEGKDFSTEAFYFNAPPQDEKLYGVLINEEGKLLPAKYIGLLKVENDLSFDYKNKGVFEVTVPRNKKVINFDFLGYKQEINKGPWVRVVAIKTPSEYVKKATEQSEEIIKAGLFEDNKITNENLTLRVGIVILGLISVIGVTILKRLSSLEAKKK